MPFDELNAKFDPLLGAKLPVAAVANKGKQVVSEDSSATVTVVAIAAVPEVSWFPEVFTPGKFIFAVPSKDTPCIVHDEGAKRNQVSPWVSRLKTCNDGFDIANLLYYATQIFTLSNH